MTEFVVGGQQYRATKMDTFKQFHVARRLLKVISTLAPMMKDGRVDNVLDALPIMAAAIGEMRDEDADYILKVCLEHCQRNSGGVWGKVRAGDVLMFEDIGLPEMMQITWKVIEENLASFMPALPQSSPGAAA